MKAISKIEITESFLEIYIVEAISRIEMIVGSFLDKLGMPWKRNFLQGMMESHG
jgi:hypothetical protein